MGIVVIDRATGKCFDETVAGENFLRWGCETAFGRAVMDLVGSKKTISWVAGQYQNSGVSTKHIKPFIANLDIDMDEAEISDFKNYSSFNDFFSRKLKPGARVIDNDDRTLVSPVDARVLAYQTTEGDKLIQVKDRYYSMKSLLTETFRADTFKGGCCVVARLNPSDYHRFHFPIDCEPGPTRKINGRYYSVNPLALNTIENVYSRNTRHITYLETKSIGIVGMVEVGASMVGSIVQTFHPGMQAEKGTEKGYFQFGGSTVILLLQPGMVELDDDLVNNTSEGFETLVKMGQGIGTIKDVKQV